MNFGLIGGGRAGAEYEGWSRGMGRCRRCLCKDNMGEEKAGFLPDELLPICPSGLG